MRYRRARRMPRKQAIIPPRRAATAAASWAAVWMGEHQHRQGLEQMKEDSMAWSMLQRLARALVYAVALVLILIGLGIGTLQSAWGMNQLRRLVIRQANQYLAASLEI